MEENNNNDEKVVEQIKDTAKNGAKSLGKKVATKAIKWAWPYLSILLLILLALGFINYMFYLIQSFFTDIFNTDDPEATQTSEINSIIEIDSNGRYKYKEDFSEEILKRLEELYVSNEAMGFSKDSADELDKDMINKYMKAYLSTMLPDNGMTGNDVDGRVKIKRTLYDDDGYLTYMKYSDFEEKFNSDPSSVLGNFSINEKFELCIAVLGSSTTYWDYQGNVIESMSTGTPAKIKPFDYQTFIEGYATPFNFFISLHLIAQDKDFMEDVVDMVTREYGDEYVENPIVLTFVESSTSTSQEITYSGTKTVKWTQVRRNLRTGAETYNPDPPQTSNYGISNSNIEQIESETNGAFTVNPDYARMESQSNSGRWDVTKADTWLKILEKEITSTPVNVPSSPDPEYINLGPYVDEYNHQEASRIIEEFDRTTTSYNITKTTTISGSGQSFRTANEQSEMKVDEFAKFIEEKYPKVKENLITAPSQLFYFLQQSESTQNMEKIMRYVIYRLSGVDYGVTEESELADLFDVKKQQFNAARLGLSSYLRQFSHAGEAPKSADGNYYKMYGDGSGWPTIGNADIQWQSHGWRFNLTGKVLENGQEKEVNIQQYVNSKLLNGPEAQYTDSEIDSYEIYVEVNKVDEIGDSLRETFYNGVLEDTEGLELSKQQLYALTAIAYNFGSLPERNGKTFAQVYVEGLSNGCEINSWEHNMYIWTNWWALLGGMTAEGGRAGLIKGRDAAFETYVKGVFDFSTSEAGTVFDRIFYYFYTQEELNMYDYATPLPLYRESLSEEEVKELFTYEAGALGGDLLNVAKSIHDYMADSEHYYYYCLGGASSHENEHRNAGIPNCGLASTFEQSQTPGSYGYRLTCCATYVSWVLQELEYIDTHYDYCSGLAGELGEHGWTEVENYNDLQPGDIVFFETDGVYGNGLDHVEILVEVTSDGTYLYYGAGSNDTIHTYEPRTASWTILEAYRMN